MRSSRRTVSGLPMIRFSTPECFRTTSMAAAVSSGFALRSSTSNPDIILLPVLFSESRYNAFRSRRLSDEVLLSELGMKVKVFRLEIEVGRNHKVLLEAGYRIC